MRWWGVVENIGMGYSIGQNILEWDVTDRELGYRNPH